jgi:hypothetical protein
MQMKSLSKLLVAIAALTLPVNGFAEEVEYDVCICKHAQVGAQSSLRGGVCQRTEAGNCLMQWGATSKQKPPIGKGYSQEEAALKAEEFIKFGLKGDFKITALTAPPPGNFSSLQFAIANLSRLPPEAYDMPGMVESFVLAASTALARFDVSLETLAADLLRERRKQLVTVLRSEGSFAVKGSRAADSFEVKGRLGCLQIDALDNKVHIYIKTPFAKSEAC